MLIEKCDQLICNKITVKSKDNTKLWIKIVRLAGTFLLGLVIATVFHSITEDYKVRKTAEKVCEVFARNELECKGGIDSVFDIANNEVQNNLDVEE